MAKRLIDADALMEKLSRMIDYCAKDPKVNGLTALFQVCDAIMDCPAVDAVVLPCKVGDLVYAMWSVPTNCKYIIYCAEVKEIRIAMRNCRVTTTYILEPIEYRGRRQEYRDDDFGNLVFLTREEAEAALAKIDGGKEK